jgi:hypothetical protein
MNLEDLMGGQHYDATGLPTLSNIPVAGVNEAATAPLSGEPTEAPKTLARLQPNQGRRGGRGIGGALGSIGAGHTMQKSAPANKAAAVLDGLMGGLADSQRAQAATAKMTNDQLKQRFDMLMKLAGRDREIARDNRAIAKDEFDQKDRATRTGAYVEYLKGGGAKKGPADPDTLMKRDKAFNELLKEEPATKRLAQDADEQMSSRKLKGPERLKLEEQAKAERAALRKKYGFDPEGETTPATPAATPAKAAPVDRSIPSMVGAPGLTHGATSGTPDPAAAPMVGTSAPAEPPRRPAELSAPSPTSPESVLDEARSVLQRGADPLAVLKRMEEAGFDPSPLAAELGLGAPPAAEQPTTDTWSLGAP